MEGREHDHDLRGHPVVFYVMLEREIHFHRRRPAHTEVYITRPHVRNDYIRHGPGIAQHKAGPGKITRLYLPLFHHLHVMPRRILIVHVPHGIKPGVTYKESKGEGCQYALCNKFKKPHVRTPDI